MWRRAAHTPLRDVVRLRLSGRLDIEGPIAAAGVPAPAADLVRRVVRRTGLWRLEKVEIARELAGHFADGLRSGATVAELVERFGDERVAARLIARSARRKRAAGVKVALRAMQGLVVLAVVLLLVYGLVTLRFYKSRPTVARNFAAELNAPVLAIPPEQRAWPAYRAAAASLGGRVSGAEHLSDARPGDARWPRVAEFLRAHAQTLAAVRAAAAMPHLGVVLSDQFDPALFPEMVSPGAEPSPNPEMIGVLLPNLGDMRRLSRLLAADMRLAASEGDAERAAADAIAVMGMVDHAREQRMYIADYVALAMLSSGLAELGRVLHEYPELFKEAQLVGLAHRVSACAGGGRLTIRLESERLAFEDLLQRTFTDDGHGSGRPTAAGVRQLSSLTGESQGMDPMRLRRFINPVAAELIADRREQREMYDRLMAAAEARMARPLWEWGEEVAAASVAGVADPVIGEEGIRYLPVRVMFPAADHAALSGELTTQKRDAVLAALAVTVHRLRTGSYPESLEQLVPGLLPSVPRDRYDGGRIKYRLAQQGPVLYSIGVDRKDDGGRRAAVRDGYQDKTATWLPRGEVAERLDGRFGPELDGDWVLWPSRAPTVPVWIDGVEDGD